MRRPSIAVLLLVVQLALPLVAGAETRPPSQGAATAASRPKSGVISALAPDLVILAQEVRQGQWSGGTPMPMNGTKVIETILKPSFRYVATVKNAGGSPVPMNYTLPGSAVVYGVGYAVTATIDGGVAKEWKSIMLGMHTADGIAEVHELPAGGTVKTTVLALEDVPFGTHAICFKADVDTGGAVAEKSEGNNGGQFCFTAEIGQLSKPTGSQQGPQMPPLHLPGR